MPRYFFDTDINGQLLVDDEGAAFPDLSSAKREALTVIYELASEIEEDIDVVHAILQVRDDARAIVLAIDLDVKISDRLC